MVVQHFFLWNNVSDWGEYGFFYNKFRVLTCASRTRSDTREFHNLPNKRGSTPLRETAFDGHVDVVRCLLQDERVKAGVDENDNTILKQAVYEGHG